MRVALYSILCFLIGICFANISCDHGLGPISSPTGFSGKIIYRGVWPTNVTQNKLIASKIYRKFRDFLEIQLLILTTDSIKVYPAPDLALNLPSNVDTTLYEFHLPTGEYKYIAVVQAYNDYANPANWKVVGVYSDREDREPKTVFINEHELKTGVDIIVDFNSLPPQPIDTIATMK